MEITPDNFNPIKNKEIIDGIEYKYELTKSYKYENNTIILCNVFKKNNNKIFSIKAINYLNYIADLKQIYIKHALNGGEYKIPNTKYRADGYSKITNTIYEFHGTIYHGDPRVCNRDENNYLGNNYGKIYDQTLERENDIKKLGYNLVVMWEYDWNKFIKSVIILQKKFKGIIIRKRKRKTLAKKIIEIFNSDKFKNLSNEIKKYMVKTENIDLLKNYYNNFIKLNLSSNEKKNIFKENIPQKIFFNFLNMCEISEDLINYNLDYENYKKILLFRIFNEVSNNFNIIESFNIKLYENNIVDFKINILIYIKNFLNLDFINSIYYEKVNEILPFIRSNFKILVKKFELKTKIIPSNYKKNLKFLGSLFKCIGLKIISKRYKLKQKMLYNLKFEYIEEDFKHSTLIYKPFENIDYSNLDYTYNINNFFQKDKKVNDKL